MENLDLIDQDFSTPKYQNYKTFRSNTDNYKKGQHCGDCLIEHCGGDINKKQHLIRSSASTGSIPPQLMVYERAHVFIDECDTLENPYNPRNTNYTSYQNEDLEISGANNNWIAPSTSAYNSNNNYQLEPVQKYCPLHYNKYYNKDTSTMNNNNNRPYHHHQSSISSMNLKSSNYCYENNDGIRDKNENNRSFIYGNGCVNNNNSSIGSNITIKRPTKLHQVFSSNNNNHQNIITKKQSMRICTIVFFSLIFIAIINGTIRGIGNILNFIKLKLDNIIKKLWKKWDLSSLLHSKKSTQFTVLILSPILAIIGIFYSLICILLIINIKFKCSVPNTLIKRINFNRLLGN